MMIRFLSLFFSAIFSFTLIAAQSSEKADNNAVSIEAGKSGALFNLTYDHRFNKKSYGFRAVAGSSLTKYLTASVVGGGLYYLKGSAKNFLELGADLVYLNVSESRDDQRTITLFYPDYAVKTIYPSLNLGYRHYGKGFLFRAGFSPGFIKSNFIPGGYISFGAAF